MSLLQAAQSLVERAAGRGKRGRIMTDAELQTLRHRLLGLYPSWLGDLLTSTPLCGLELGWQAYPPAGDFDGIQWMEWAGAAGVMSESVDCYPGAVILSSGYVNVASCSGGSGDPYFICIHDGPDPPLYQVFHDVSDRTEVILAEGRALVAASLSQFFASAFVG